jgi:hypothetical protein
LAITFAPPSVGADRCRVRRAIDLAGSPAALRRCALRPACSRLGRVRRAALDITRPDLEAILAILTRL